MASNSTSRSSHDSSPEQTPPLASRTAERTQGLPESKEQREEASLLVTTTSLPQLTSCYQHRNEISVVEKCYTSYQEKILTNKQELTSMNTSRKCQKRMKISPYLEAEVYLKPNTIREGVECCLEVRLEVATKGDLQDDIRNKTKTCFLRVVTSVTESESRHVLAQYTNKKLFPMTDDDGSAGYEWKLIGSEELEKCSANKVTVCIEIFLHIREWRDYYEASIAENADDFVTIFTHTFSSD